MKKKLGSFDEFINEANVSFEINESLFLASPEFNIYTDIKTAKQFKNWTRGVIMEDGTFYVFNSERGFVVHDAGLKVLYANGIIKKSYHGWDNEQPWQFLCMQRLEDTDEFYTAESYRVKIQNDIAERFIKAAQKRADSQNSNIIFYNEKIKANSY